MLKRSSILYISLRYLKSNKNHNKMASSTIISFLGVSISVATLIVVLSVMNGFVSELTKKILGTNSHLTLNNYGMSPIINYEDTIAELRKIKDVSYVNSIIEGQGMLINTEKNISSGSIIKGFLMHDLQSKPELWNSFILHPDCENDIFLGKNGIIIGSLLAKSIGIGIGEKVSLVTAAGDKTLFGFMPRYKDFFVCGVFETGTSMNDSSIALVSFDSAKILFKYKNGVSGIEIFLKNYLLVDDFRKKIENNNLWNGYISDWKTSNDGLFHAMKIERVVMSFILSLFLIVSMFGIFANMNSMVSSKTKNIAIMLSMGFTKKNIATIFFLSGAIIGALGTVCGCIFGIVFAKNIQTIKVILESATGTSLFDGAVYFLSYLPSEIFTSDVIFIACLSIFFTILSSIFPAIKASKVNISEALRQI